MAVLFLLLVAPAAGAQDEGAPSAVPQLSRSIRFAVDNDFFDFSRPPRERPDDNYTQGMHVSWDLRRVPRFARALLCGGQRACGTTLQFGQEIYTSTYYSSYPFPGDRPFAGWLYGTGRVDGATEHGLWNAALTIGVTGPPSFAGSAQRAFHHLVPGFYEPIGWISQLPTEPAFAIRGTRSWRIAAPGPIARYVDAIPSVHGTAGTVRMAAGAGVRARIGVPLLHPWLASERPRVALSAFAGLSAEAVAWDLFLDGTVFRESAHTTHKQGIAEWEHGAALHLRRFALEYRAVTRSREYPAGPRTHTYGSFQMSWVLQ